MQAMPEKIPADPVRYVLQRVAKALAVRKSQCLLGEAAIDAAEGVS